MSADREADYYRHHADAYDVSSLGVRGDVEFYRALALEAGGPVVEVGVGTGRIAIPIAQAGVDVIGIDNAAPMLEIARGKAAEAGVADHVRLVRGDMRSFAVDEPVPLVLIPYRTFLHNLETADQLATLAACRAALQPGGRLALNVFNPDIRLIAGWLGLSPDEWRRDAMGRETSARFEPTAQVVRSRIRVRDAAGVSHDASLELRYVYRYEMEHLLARSGFAVEALYGDFEDAPFTETATEMVWVARREA